MEGALYVIAGLRNSYLYVCARPFHFKQESIVFPTVITAMYHTVEDNNNDKGEPKTPGSKCPLHPNTMVAAQQISPTTTQLN